jgi:predicted nucleic acid-binding protein
MILADTTIWIDHLRSPNTHLINLLHSISIGTHPMVIGELACGTLPKRDHFIREMRKLPQLVPASDDEVLYFIDRHKLMGRGIGYVDVHLLVSAKLNGMELWTRDMRLRESAAKLHIAYQAPSGLTRP